jgi:hypothetical protein
MVRLGDAGARERGRRVGAWGEEVRGSLLAGEGSREGAVGLLLGEEAG